MMVTINGEKYRLPLNVNLTGFTLQLKSKRGQSQILGMCLDHQENILTIRCNMDNTPKKINIKDVNKMAGHCPFLYRRIIYNDSWRSSIVR